MFNVLKEYNHKIQGSTYLFAANNLILSGFFNDEFLRGLSPLHPNTSISKLLCFAVYQFVAFTRKLANDSFRYVSSNISNKRELAATKHTILPSLIMSPVITIEFIIIKLISARCIVLMWAASITSRGCCIWVTWCIPIASCILGVGVSSLCMACMRWGNSSIPIVLRVLSYEEATVLVKVIWEKVHHKTICSTLLGGGA